MSIKLEDVVRELSASDDPALSGASPLLQRLHQITICNCGETFGIKVFEVEGAQGGSFADNFNSIARGSLLLDKTTKREVEAERKREPARGEREEALQDAVSDFGSLLPRSRWDPIRAGRHGWNIGYVAREAGREDKTGESKVSEGRREERNAGVAE